jgi:hypothetical protein
VNLALIDIISLLFIQFKPDLVIFNHFLANLIKIVQLYFKVYFKIQFSVLQVRHLAKVKRRYPFRLEVFYAIQHND